MRWLTTIIVFVLAAVMILSCAVLNPGPDKPTVCFDKQWSKNIEFFELVSVPSGESIGTYKLTTNGLPKNTPVYDIPARQTSLYVYPSSRTRTSSWDSGYVTFVVLEPVYTTPNGNFIYGNGVAIEATIEGEVIIGGTKDEPKRAMKHLIIIPPNVASGTLFFLKDPTKDIFMYQAIVRVR